MDSPSPRTYPFLDWHGLWAGYASYDERGHYFPQDMPSGVRLSLQEAEQTEPVMRRERRWEAGNIHYPIVSQEEGRFRMWYMAFASEADPWVRAGHILGKYPALFCYAESADGIQWERPNLGLYDYDGSRENNILFACGEVGPCGYTHIFRDPNGPDAERYKAIGIDAEFRIDGRPAGAAEAKALMGKRQAAGDGQAEIAAQVTHQVVMKAGVSPDGLHWTHLPEPILRPPYLLDTQNILTYDAESQRYVMYLRGHRDRRRAVVRYESPEFRTGWERPLTVLAVDPQDPPDWDIYAPCYCRYPGGTAHLMFFNPYHRAADVLDVRLAISHDGLHWCRPERKAVVPVTGQYGMLSPSPGLVSLDSDRWGLLILAHPNAHNEKANELVQRSGETVHPGAREGRDWDRTSVYFWATWKRDRLVALEADAYAEVTLVDRVCSGEPIRLNLQTRHGGWVKAELVTGIPNRQLAVLPPPLPGFSFDDCEPLSGDALDAPIRWKSGADLTALRGKKLHLRLRMAQTKLFAVTM